MTQTALILGASGRFGRHAARAFEAAGWTVRRFDRKTDDLNTAMKGADVTVNAMNPPDYTTWARDLLPIHARVIDAAKATGTTVILPGNVYVFGPDAPFGWTADSPRLAADPLGQLRIEMERMYRESGVQTIILRCGDFIDTEKTGNWFEGHLANKAVKGRFAYPGDPDAPHAWAYLPDAARAAVALAEVRDTLATFEDVPFAGWTLSGREMADAIGEAIGRDIRLGSVPWGLFRLLTPVMPVMTYLRQMRYLWNLPQRLDGTKLARLVPSYRDTPPAEGLRQALAWQMPKAPARSAMSLA